MHLIESATMNQQILLVVTSHATLGDTGKPTGIWAEELAAPYNALIDAGHTVEIASPKGGAVPFDPGSLKPRGENPATVERFLADEEARQKAANTLTVADMDAADFDAIFFPGGHGTMWDLPFDEGVTQLVADAYLADRIIASVCHGAAGLVSAKRPDGQSILQGKRVNSFTDAEEAAVGLTNVVPFTLESRIRALGGIYECAANWQPFAVRDGKLITGQNPQSSELVAQRVIEALAE